TKIVLLDGTELPLSASIIRAGFARATTAPGEDPKLKGEEGGGNLAVIAQGGLQGATVGVWTRSAQAAAVGAGIGAAVGLASVLFKRGPDLDLPRNTPFEARIEQAIVVPAAAVQRSASIAARNPRRGLIQDNIELHDEPLPEDRDAPRPVLRRRDSPEEATPSPAQLPAPAAEAAPDIPSTPAAAAANPPEPAPADASGGFTLTVDVPLVVVETVVRDRDGRLVDDLKQEDFRLYENGVEQTIANFSRDELPLAVALVIDRSGSVMPYMPELREAAWQALSQLKRGDQVALFAFASDVERLEDLTSDRGRIAERITDISGGGGTNIVDAVHDAVSYLGMVAPRRRRAVILVSDNQGTVHSRAGESQTIQLALETETVIYSVKTPGVGIPLTMRLPNLLNTTGSVPKIARETGGEVLETDRSTVGQALKAAVDRLRRRYTLGYTSSAPFRDGSFRTIRVRLAEGFGKPPQDYSIHTRRGYYPPAAKISQAPR
ncbi:VWA domain-containing protein, partial [bacterium]